MADSVPAPTLWTIVPTDVRAGFLGGLGLATTLRFTTRGELGEIVAAANSIGREAVRDKLRERLAADDSPPLQRYRRVQGEAAGLALEARQLDATLQRLRAERAETIALAASGFARRVVEQDRQIAEVSGRVAQARQASEAVAATVADAKAEASKAVSALAQQLSSERYSSIRTRRAEIVAELPAILSSRLSELAALERSLALGASGGFTADLDAMVDAAAAMPDAAPAVSSEPAPPSEEASAESNGPVPSLAAPTDAPPAAEPPPVQASPFEEAAEPLEPSGPRRRKA